MLFGDSIFVGLLFNSTLQLKNTLLRNAIVNTNVRANQMLEYFPKATIYYSFVPGKQNPSDYLSKLFFDPIEAVNSIMWRNGPDILRKEETFFYKVDITGDEFLGLPEKYIQRPVKEEVENIDIEG